MLAKCRECGREVRRLAFCCPHCRTRFPGLNECPGGQGWEWKSEKSLWGYPLVHVAIGVDERRRPLVARGIVAIGQVGIGAVTFAQAGVGVVFGLGQVVVAPLAVGQVAVGLLAAAGQAAVALLVGLGQLAMGYVAIGQAGFGTWVLCQMGEGAHVWSMARRDPEAVAFFRSLLQWFGL